MKTLKRRRKEHKTDYARRIRLLKSGAPRIVFRKSNKYLTAQLVTSREAQDKAEMGLSSSALLKYGWPENFKNSLKSVPAAYLLGLLAGTQIADKKIKKSVVDFGMIRTINKNKLFGFLKGLKDSGLAIECDDKHFPSEDRVKGKHLKEDFSKHFDAIKKKIENSGGKSIK